MKLVNGPTMQLLVTFLQLAPTVTANTPTRLPTWGGCASFSTQVNMTDIADAPTSPHWRFSYSYMTDNANNATYSRYEHESHALDEVCRGILGAPRLGTAACVAVHSTNDNWLYISFPSAGFCCKCTRNVGAVRSDWLIDGGAKYTGRVAKDSNGAPFGSGIQQADGWLKMGASDNHYYATADEQERPVRYMEHKNGKLKQWDFVLDTFSCQNWTTPPAALFAPPSNCERRCVSAMCSF